MPVVDFSLPPRIKIPSPICADIYIVHISAMINRTSECNSCMYSSTKFRAMIDCHGNTGTCTNPLALDNFRRNTLSLTVA